MRAILCCLIAAGPLWAHAQAPVLDAQLYVTTTPAGATVLWDGETKGVTPMTLSDLEPGRHLLTIQKAGYLTIRDTVDVEAGKKTALQLPMEALTGLIIIDSNPQDAVVEVNGADRGKTPVLITDLPLGKYRVRLTKNGYLDKEIDLTLDGRTPQKVKIDLPSDSGTLVLTSTPEGAAATVNGIARGNTPVTIERIPEGETTLELSLDGYEPYKHTVKLAPGETQELRAVLKPVPAQLKVVSIPPGARIYVENQFKGETPLTIEDLEPGAYRVRAELVAHEPMARTIELAGAQQLVEEFRLESNSGVFELITEPAGVQVFVDGKEMGQTAAKPDETDRVSEPLKMALLTIGDHEVQLVKQGYFEKKFPIAIEKNKTVAKHERLEQRFIPDYEVTTPTRVYRGVLKGVDGEGNIRLEIRPGVITTISRDKVRSRRPIRQDTPEKEKEKEKDE